MTEAASRFLHNPKIPDDTKRRLRAYGTLALVPVQSGLSSAVHSSRSREAKAEATAEQATTEEHQ